MKIRTGFVTNSSTANYILAFKGDNTEENLRIATLRAFGVDTNHIFLTRVFKDIEKYVKYKSKQIPRHADISDDYFGDGFESACGLDEGIKLANAGFNVYVVPVSSEDFDGVVAFLYKGMLGGEKHFPRNDYIVDEDDLKLVADHY